MIYAVRATEPQRRMFADSLQASLTVSEMQYLVERLQAPPESVRQTSDRHWTWCTRKACCNG